MATATRAKPSPATSDDEDPRLGLRRRWELASVLHFLRVFEPVIQGDLGLPAEEVETALISANDDLARIHITLLKGIPPATKNLKDGDEWITTTAKKLSSWWPWVAEGANPLKTDPGKEVDAYKQHDPIKRLLILKALCEVRAEQDDAVWYINDELKKGTNISHFRKEKLGDGGNGSIYWYDGDSTIGYRLYKEEVRVDFKQNWKGKRGRLTKPVVNLHWETVATNLDEFLQISESLSSSKGQAEVVVGEIVKTEIVPVIEELQKKKERALKRQQKKAARLEAFPNGFPTRALRERRPVSYNYFDYDRSINEAIREAMKAKADDPQKDAGKRAKHAPGHKDRAADGITASTPEHSDGEQEDDGNYLDDLASDDSGDSDYSGKDDTNHPDSNEHNDAYDPHKSNLEEKGVTATRKRTRLAPTGLDSKPNAKPGLRRSGRNVKVGDGIGQPGQVTPQAVTKKTLRQRPTPISKNFDGVPDCENDFDQTVADSEEQISYSSDEESDRS